jgi:hypothetical protein
MMERIKMTRIIVNHSIIIDNPRFDPDEEFITDDPEINFCAITDLRTITCNGEVIYTWDGTLFRRKRRRIPNDWEIPDPSELYY